MRDAIDRLRAALDRWETAKANGVGAVAAGQTAAVLIAPALAEAEELRARVAELEARWLSCRQCGKPTEPARHCYATPVCFACLPPPPPLPVREWRAPDDDGLED